MPTDLREQLRPHIAKVGQSEAARLSGIPRPQISQWLAGTRGMPLDRIELLAAALGFEVVISLRRKRQARARTG